MVQPEIVPPSMKTLPPFFCETPSAMTQSAIVPAFSTRTLPPYALLAEVSVFLPPVMTQFVTTADEPFM